MTIHYRDNAGNYLGGFDIPPNGGIETLPPEHADQKWNGTDWDALPVDHPSNKVIRKPGQAPVTRNEFNALLDILGIK